MKKNVIILVFIMVSSLSNGQNLDKRILIPSKDYQETNTNSDSLSIQKPDKKEKSIFKLGLQTGTHSANLNKYGTFNNGIFVEAYLKYNLSSEIHSTIAFSYWKAQNEEINTLNLKLPSETLISNAIKFGLDFSLFNLSEAMFLLGTSLSFENISKANFTVFTFGANFKLIAPLWHENISLLSTIGYQKGAEINEFDYSFFNYLIGIEINMSGILKK